MGGEKITNELQIFNYGSKQVRTELLGDDEIFFCGKDLCDILEITNSGNAYSRLDINDKVIRSTDTPGGKQETVFISEAGLYELVLASRKPEAKHFKRWVTHEVLPSIRKHGAYMTPDTLDKMISSPEFGIKLLTALQDERTKRLQAESTLAIAAPKAESWTQIAEDEGVVWSFRDAAKIAAVPGLNERRMKDIAKSLKWILLDGKASAHAIRDGLIRMMVRTIENGRFKKTEEVAMLRPKGLDKLVREYKKLTGSLTYSNIGQP